LRARQDRSPVSVERGTVGERRRKVGWSVERMKGAEGDRKEGRKEGKRDRRNNGGGEEDISGTVWTRRKGALKG